MAQGCVRDEVPIAVDARCANATAIQRSIPVRVVPKHHCCCFFAIRTAFWDHSNCPPNCYLVTLEQPSVTPPTAAGSPSNRRADIGRRQHSFSTLGALNSWLVQVYKPLPR